MPESFRRLRTLPSSRRAIHTLEEVLVRLESPAIPTRYAWELNERHYGALQGKGKAETEREFGPERTLSWRRSFR